MSDSKCLARPDKLKAIVALGAPFLAFAALIYDMRSDGLGPWEYLSFLFFSVPEGLVGLILLGAYWIYRYWGPAIEALACEHCLIRKDAQKLFLACNRDLNLENIFEVTGKNDLRGKWIIIKYRNGEQLSQSGMFMKEGFDQVINEISRVLQKNYS